MSGNPFGWIANAASNVWTWASDIENIGEVISVAGVVAGGVAAVTGGGSGGKSKSTAGQQGLMTQQGYRSNQSPQTSAPSSAATVHGFNSPIFGHDKYNNDPWLSTLKRVLYENEGGY